ncbi:protein of unknown function (plasmid) [Cupriavidus taiwanensis]|uniref:Uncharacterized protein n=1 Tax=Cupriavidus taiwanensis TaxID=164546 RepID=A0A375HA46_9BURK|nr:protein of unknown function [Cupriavidus taiwanensis]SOZ72113.1 protein of unknown function [Cupriavidus taiwanensis]SOZ74405.1 protein of unknown function [Cupriavidus taiwanensis]SPD48871.1 protein of unknown function [Cupriavidus taiwanensis]
MLDEKIHYLSWHSGTTLTSARNVLRAKACPTGTGASLRDLATLGAEQGIVQ